MKLIIGLGNPGKKYEQTRHNVGFMILDELARLHHLTWNKQSAFKALTAQGSNYLLVKPQTFMNDSGESVDALARYYKVRPRGMFGVKKDSDLTDSIIVIQDELDLPLGTYKISQNRSSAGHNGIQSVIDHIKTKNFTRLRIGINGPKKGNIPGQAFVLQNFDEEEMETIHNLMPEIISNLGL